MLQTRTIFTNVSKGVLAKEKDLEEAFGTTDAHAICLEILKKGELQVMRGSAMMPCTWSPSPPASLPALPHPPPPAWV